MKYDRQIDIIDVDKLRFPIHVIGAGGIGSWTALLLAKMGCSNVTVYDFDEVEEHNVASQFYKESQLGELKLDALQENIKEQSGLSIIRGSVDDEPKINEGLIIIAVDSMEMRDKLAKMYKDTSCYIIDGRMGGLQLEIYTRFAKNYPSTIVASEDVSHEPCTAKAICFNCAVIGGLICNYVRLFANGDIKEQDIIFGFNDIMLLKKST